MQTFIPYHLAWISYLILFGGLAIWAKYDKRGIIKVLSGYYLICAILIIKIALSRGTGISNIYIYSILCVLSSFGIGAYFYSILFSRWAKALVIFFCGLNGAYYAFINLFSNGLAVFDSNAYTLLSVNIIALYIAYVMQIMQNVTEAPLSENIDFWLSASQILYFTGSFVIFLTFGYLTQKILDDPSNQRVSFSLARLWGLHNVLLFLSSLLTVGGIAWILYRKK